jgi:hypothetical protein
MVRTEYDSIIKKIVILYINIDHATQWKAVNALVLWSYLAIDAV